jgi:hypothetical protein
MALKRAVWVIAAAVALVAAVWLAVYFVVGTGSESGPTITEVSTGNG